MIPGPGMFIVIFQGGSRQANVLMRCNECIPICRQIARAPGASDSSPALSLSGPWSGLRVCNLESDAMRHYMTEKRNVEEEERMQVLEEEGREEIEEY